MIEEKKEPQLVKTKWGFYQYAPLPSVEELSKYYAETYYQKAEGSYDLTYSDEEIAHRQLWASLVRLKATQLVGPGRKSSLDIGCGEGWLLDEFHKHNYAVEGVDFSRFGFEKFHPYLLPFFIQANIYEFLQEQGKQVKKRDVIILDNVIEHVIDPAGLLHDVKQFMTSKSLLIIEAPNDFSQLHEYLLKYNYISRKFWLSYPEHLSYFNKESMTNMLSSSGFTVCSIVADHPIDLELLNDNSNYVNDPSKGKNTHLYRVRSNNFFASTGIEKMLAYYEALGDMGVGRNLIYFCSLQQS